MYKDRASPLKGLTPRLTFPLSLVILLLLAFPPCHAGQDPDTASSYFGHIEAICRDRCDEFLQKLRALDVTCNMIDQPCEAGQALLQDVYGPTYHPLLPNYVVYFDQSEGASALKKHRPVLLWNGENTPHLYGVRDLYVVVLTEHKLCLGATLTTNYMNEPNPFSGIFRIFGAGSDVPTAKPPERRPARFTWYPLSGNPKVTPLWFATTHFTIDSNIAGRLSVRFIEPGEFPKDPARPEPPSECVAPTPGVLYLEVEGGSVSTSSYRGDFLLSNAFFSNSPEGFATVSFALGVTTNTRNTSLGSDGGPISQNAYALAKFYIQRPQLKAGAESTGIRHSWGIVFGTNIARSPLDEAVVGVSLGHLVGNMGLVAGANSIAAREGTNEGRKFRPFFAIDYSF